MITSQLRERFHLTVLVLLTSALAAGCGRSATVEEVCSKCGTDSASITKCVDSNTQAKAAFDTIGCGGEFQALLDCAFDNDTCIEDREGSDGCEQKRVNVLNCFGAL
jgi:hypothetical protein